MNTRCCGALELGGGGCDGNGQAKDKPITFISGSELLGLLERHGHTAKINLAEARAQALEASENRDKPEVTLKQMLASTKRQSMPAFVRVSAVPS